MDLQTPEEIVDFLARTELVGALPRDLLAALLPGMRVAHCAAGERVFEQGEPGDAAYFVVAGRVRLESAGIELVQRAVFECFGEFALIDDGERSATAIAVTGTTLLRWERDAFHAALDLAPQLARAVFRMLTAKLREELIAHAALSAERERMERDLSFAREIQAGMLPAAVEDLGGLSLAGHCRPAAEVGGDFFDYLAFADGSVGVIIADVTGHGFYAGLFVAMAKSALHAQVRVDPSPQAVMGALRRSLSLSPAGSLLMSCCYLRVDVAAGELEYANAGHPGVLHWSAHDGSTGVLGALDPILGVLDEDAPVRTERARVCTGDVLVLYSDGLIETRGSSGMYGEERLLAELQVHAPQSSDPPALLREVLDAVSDHSAGAPADDDLTVLVARVGAMGSTRRG